MRAGRLILMGSGEMSGRLVAAHRLGVEAAGAGEVVVLDTPYGSRRTLRCSPRG